MIVGGKTPYPRSVGTAPLSKGPHLKKRLGGTGVPEERKKKYIKKKD